MAEQIEVESIRRLDIKPGEVLVVQIPLRTDKEIASVRDQLLRLLPEGIRVIVTGPDVDMQVIKESEAGRIAEAVRKATENPGRMVSVDDPWTGFPLEGDEVQR